MRVENTTTPLARAIAKINIGGHAAAIAALLVCNPMSASAQDTTLSDRQMGMLEEVVVTARRKDESIQDVPLTVNVVTAEALDNLNIRKFEDLSSVVAGLTLSEDSIAPSASVRGVRFDTFASGFNPTVEFYMNDAPIVALAAMQAMFDVGQIEVLRGPQGTLRGRASPSGSITITSRRPVLNEFEGYVDATANNKSKENYQAAINIPLIEDKMALRVAGYYEENDGDHVKSLTTGEESHNRGDGWRVSLLMQPTDNLSINLMTQQMTPQRWQVPHVESAFLQDPTLPGSSPVLKASDRKGVSIIPTYSKQVLERTNAEVQWEFDNYQLNYAGSYTEQSVERKMADDGGNYFGMDAAPELQSFGQALLTDTNGYSHELRLSSSEPLFDGRMDYVVGGMYQYNNSPSNLTNPTAIFMGSNYLMVVETPIIREGDSTEKSAFGNLTFYLTDDTEMSVGARHIKYETHSLLNVSGNVLSDTEHEWSHNIFSASLKHQFADDIMGYFSYGSSWRPGVEAVGNFSYAQTPLERSFVELEPETSDSYEVGMKSTWLDNRLRLNVSAYYQEFDNYPYRVGGSGVYHVSTDVDGTESTKLFNFVAAVPVKVHGVEIESSLEITDSWTAGLLFSWSKGEIQDAAVPCDRYGGAVPSVADVRAAAGGDNIASCNVDYRSNSAPLWTSTLQSQYSFTVGPLDAYVRGLWTLYGDSQNDPGNPVDDVDGYNIFNLYAGLKDPEGRWELMLYGKNLADTERVLNRESSQASVGMTNISIGAGGVVRESVNGLTPWRTVSVTPPREFGVNVRYNF
jgi:iron complex outermembrane receptor protein